MADAYTRMNRGGHSSSAAITTHNTNPLPRTADAIFVGTGGNVACRLEGDSSDRLFKNVPNGMTLYVRATHVRTTNTTAADMVALF